LVTHDGRGVVNGATMARLIFAGGPAFACACSILAGDRAASAGSRSLRPPAPGR
jgi:hypothetical protein